MERLKRFWIWVRFYLTKWLGREGVFVDGLSRGMGNTTLRWAFTPRGSCREISEVINEVDQVVRSSPTPHGLADFLIRVKIFGSDGENGVDPEALLHEFTLGRENQDFLVNRYSDWARGDAKERLAAFLETHQPKPEAPLLLINVVSIGALVTELAEAGMLNAESNYLPT